MNAAQQFVVVKAPLERVYEQWSRIEDLPKFIPPLRDMRRIDETHFSYTWSRSSRSDDQHGVFHIVLQIPGRRIAWRTMCDGFMSGVVSFEPRSQEETEVTLKIRSIFDPPSLSQRVEEYLRNFKRLVENGEVVSAGTD
ncbi:MAG: SRPBCC family protein [Candidatus Udaeobacter sp.]